MSRRLWGGGNTSPLKTTAWEAKGFRAFAEIFKKLSRFKVAAGTISHPPVKTGLKHVLHD